MVFCIFSSPVSPSDAVEAQEDGEENATLPCTEDVICKTEQIIKNIQELQRAAQETKHERYLSQIIFLKPQIHLKMIYNY